jgi:GntR family transcriptional regulator of arabinose operon
VSDASNSEKAKRDLIRLIETGALAEGAVVPSEKEVAERYGLSRSRAHLILRELTVEGYIDRSQGRRSRVALAAKRLSRLSVQPEQTFAFSFPGCNTHYCAEILRGFMRHTSSVGYQSIIYDLRVGDQTERNLFRHIRRDGVAGMAVWLHHFDHSTLSLLKGYADRGFPLVLVDRYVEGLEVDAVVSNNEHLGYTLTRRLLERGHERIGFIGTMENVTSVQDRFRGYRRALDEAEAPFSKGYVGQLKEESRALSLEPSDEHARRVVRDILGLRQAPTAFACVTDFVAAKLIGELESAGYRVPDDVEVATVDDGDYRVRIERPVIKVSQDGFAVGHEAASLLLARTRNPQAPAERRFVEPQDGQSAVQGVPMSR